MEASEYLSTVEALHRDARARRLFFQGAQGDALRGRTVVIEGREMLSFGSCSYLGLEHDPRLIEAAAHAAASFGTQFSSSRGYLSAPPYETLETLLAELFEAHVLVTPSTTLGHLATLPVLITERDALVLDHQVHHSVQMAATQVRAHGATVRTVRHEELGRALEVVAELARTHDHVWFATDGVTSMYGDLAPHHLLGQLLEIGDNVRLYIDDAHGMSWDGRHGRGSFLHHTELEPRIVVATSLNKAFAASGGCLVSTDAEVIDRVRMLGGPMLFGGPLQPPMLGAAVASARLHLSSELAGLQRTLRQRVTLTNTLSREHGLPLLVENETPIFFYRLGLPRVAAEVAQRMASDGIYVNVSMYPTVPMKRAGVRISINAPHTEAQITRLVERLAVHIPAVLAEASMTRQDLDELFAHSVVSHLGRRDGHVGGARTIAAADLVDDAANDDDVGVLQLTRHQDGITSMAAETRQRWDRLFGEVGTCSAASLAAIERSYRSAGERPEHDWRFEPIFVCDRDGRPVVATHLSVSLQKDDFLMRDEVSRAVERRRSREPYLLTSRVVMTGSALSEGNHLFVDRRGPWRAAMRKLLATMHELSRRENAPLCMLRDLPANDTEFDAFMLGEGYLKVPMLDSHVVDLDETGLDGLLARGSRRSRRHVRRVAEAAADYVVEHWSAAEGRALPDVWLDRLYQLYAQIARRKLRINVFRLPRTLFSHLAASSAWEFLTLRARPGRPAGGPGPDTPLAFLASHRHGRSMAPFFGGLDYAHLGQGHQSAYRQLIYQVLRRAASQGVRRVHLGMDADFEKQRFGSRVVHNCVYVQSQDHFNGALLREIVEQVGLEATVSA